MSEITKDIEELIQDEDHIEVKPNIEITEDPDLNAIQEDIAKEIEEEKNTVIPEKTETGENIADIPNTLIQTTDEKGISGITDEDVIDEIFYNEDDTVGGEGIISEKDIKDEQGIYTSKNGEKYRIDTIMNPYGEEEYVVKFINDLIDSEDTKIETFDFKDKRMEKAFFSQLEGYDDYIEENKKEESLASMLSEIAETGKYVDTWLPMTNILVRTYEFENDVLIFNSISPLENDLSFKNQIHQSATVSQRFMDKIVQYSKILGKDTRNMKSSDLDNLSFKDAELLMLNVAKLLATPDKPELDNEGNPKPIVIEIDTTCDSCKQENTLQIDFDKLVKDAYTEDMLQFCNENFSLDDTIEGNIARSRFSKIRGAMYKNEKMFRREGATGSIILRIKEPSYTKSKNIENKIMPYILNKYEKDDFFGDLVGNAQYISAPIKGKIAMMYRYALNASSKNNFNESTSKILDFNKDIDTMYNLTYIDRLLAAKKPKDEEKFKVIETIDISKILTVENEIDDPNKVEDTIKKLFDEIGRLPQELINDMSEKIAKLGEEGIFTFKKEFTCAVKKCSHKQVKEISAIELVFSTLQIHISRR